MVLLIQINPVILDLTLIATALLAILSSRLRALAALIWCASVGYWFWNFTAAAIYDWTVKVGGTEELAVILSRFGLIGYIFIFSILLLLIKPNLNLFHIGNFKRTIRFPLIWSGHADPIWRFLLIFCGICLASFPAIMIGGGGELTTRLIGYGLLFALVNSILEEIIWRGFILGRLVDITGEKIGLLVSSFAFGFYHYSLGFPLYVCLLFSIGGFYMGGAALKSKGLSAGVMMHFVMNLLFVFGGFIF